MTMRRTAVRALVVEEFAAERLLLVNRLRDLGVEEVLATGGLQTALDLARGPSAVDVVLCTLKGPDLQALERSHRVRFLATPDFGFAETAAAWISGATLDEVLRTTEMAAGDFVRAMKQLVDLVAQVADAAGPGPLRTTARQTLDGLRRGVVAYSSLSG